DLLPLAATAGGQQEVRARTRSGAETLATGIPSAGPELSRGREQGRDTGAGSPALRAGSRHPGRENRGGCRVPSMNPIRDATGISRRSIPALANLALPARLLPADARRRSTRRESASGRLRPA